MSVPLGNLGYHLLVSLSVVATLGMAWGEWRRARTVQAQRLLLATAGLTALRAFYLLAVLITWSGWLTPNSLLPPLERFVDTTSILLLAWVYVPAGRRGVLSWDLVFVVSLAAAVVMGVVFIGLWGQALAVDPTLNYNAYWQAPVWSVLQIGLILVVAAAVVQGQREERTAILLALGFMFLGQVLQILYPTAGSNLGWPLWERLGNLLAYPLVAIAIYQRIFAGLSTQNQQFQEIGQASLDQIKSLLCLFEVSQRVASAVDRPTLLQHAVQGVARALAADQCAIAFPLERDPNQMRLDAVYNPTRQGRTEVGVLPLEYQFAVTQAMRRRSHVLVDESDHVQLKTLFSLLGSSQTGPLLVQPLLAEGEPMGVLIVGNACSRRPFTPNEAKLCQVMADHIVTAIQNLERCRVAQDKIAEVTAARIEAVRVSQQAGLEAREQTERLSSSQAEADALRLARDALEIKLLGSRAEADTLARRVVTLEQEVARYKVERPLPSEPVPSEQGVPRAVAQTKMEVATRTLEEMRTSMTTIIAYADLLLSEAMGSVGDAQRKSLQRIKSGAEQVTHTIRDLIGVVEGGPSGNGSSGRHPSPPSPWTARVEELVDGAVAASRSQIEKKALVVDLRLADDLPPIDTAPDQLLQVLSSLLSNACLASPTGGRIEITATRLSRDGTSSSPAPSSGGDDGFVAVSVKDSGGGLPGEVLNQVFERSRPSKTPPGLGESGAGLERVKTLVETHGGRLWVESEDGIGAIFHLVFPVHVR